MLRSMKILRGYDIKAKDGEIGEAHEFYFDDEKWTVRYLVADTAKFLTGKLVLISPEKLEQPDWETKAFPVNMTKDEIENGPRVAEDLPASLQKQYSTAGLSALPGSIALAGAHTIGVFEIPSELIYDEEEIEKKNKKDKKTHLRSSREVIGYDVKSSDGDAGHIEDFIFEDETWDIKYLVIDTKDWLPGGKKVLISPDWVKNIEWEKTAAELDVSSEQIDKSPEFNPDEPVNRQTEERLYDYYGRPKYWEKK